MMALLTWMELINVFWFQYYIKTWSFYDIDDESNEICEEEDLFEHWVPRPDRP